MLKGKTDPIIAEVINNALRSITEEMGAALVRSAYSTNIKERKDCSCCLFDAKGLLLSLAEHIPIHLGSMLGLMTEIRYDLEEWNLKPKDVIIANDPYSGGGSHLPDITLLQPFFIKNKLMGFIANIAHWSDVGGRYPGVGTAGDSTEILQEGLRIPPTHISVEGQIQHELLELILLNMRCYEERYGDFKAQIASLLLGERRIQELFSKYGEETMIECIAENYNYSERRLKENIRQIPEGHYSFTDYMDDDGISEERLKISVEITVKHNPDPYIYFDFSGSSPQAAGGINMVKTALLATVYYSVKAILAPDVPFNGGFQRPIKIYAPKKTLINAQEPAAVGGRTDTCQRVVDTIMGALHQAIPEKVVAASNGATTAIIFGGNESVTGQKFTYVEALGGGMGARAMKDGTDGVQVHITNTSNLPIEAMELEYPFRVLNYELIKDSGGPGKFRGGLAIKKDIMVLKPVIFSAHSDRHKINPWGLNGGLKGKCGKFILNPDTPNEKILRSKTSGVLLEKGDVLRIMTAGGGGYGSPLIRELDLIQNDLLLEKISKKEAQDLYGIHLDEKGSVDIKATHLLRGKLRKK